MFLSLKGTKWHVQVLDLSNRYIFVPGHEGTFLSVGVQKYSFRGTDKKVQKCTLFKGTYLYSTRVLLG